MHSVCHRRGLRRDAIHHPDVLNHAVRAAGADVTVQAAARTAASVNVRVPTDVYAAAGRRYEDKSCRIG